MGEITGDTLPESNETLTVSIANVQGAVIADGTATATIQNDDAAFTSIPQIQGTGPMSKLLGQWVDTQGVVTAVAHDGFYLQSDDERRDEDPASAEGIFVASRDGTAGVGDYLRVQGNVQEVQVGDEAGQLTLTTILASRLEHLGNSRALPDAIVLDARVFRSLPSITGLERFEGMRVSVPRLSVSSPVEGVLDTKTGKMLSNGIFYGVAEGMPRPFREPGLGELESARKPPGVSPPVADSNPERLRVNSRGQRGATGLAVDAGDILAGLTGVLGYAHGAYELIPDASARVTSKSAALPRAVTPPTSAQVTIASFTLREPRSISDTAGATNESSGLYASRLAKTANAICRYAHSPDIVAISGAAGGAVVADLAGAANGKDGNLLFANACSTHTRYLVQTIGANSDFGLLINSQAVRPGVARTHVVSARALGSAESFRNRDGSREPLHPSPPLLTQARINAVDGPVLDVTILLASLPKLEGGLAGPGPHGWSTRSEYLHALRAARASSIAAMVRLRQQTHPAEKLVVLGNFETSEFSDGRADLIGAIAGREASRNRVITHLGSRVDPPLANLTSQLVQEDRYTVNREGNAVAVDHILVSNSLMQRGYGAHVEVARINADFGEDNRDDPGVPMRASDHDPLVLYLTIPQAR